MAVKTEQDTDKLIITSFPKCLSGLFVAFFVIFWIAALTGENDAGPIDYLMFSSILLIGVAIQKYKITTLDKKYNEAILVTKSVLGTKTQKFIFNDIKEAHMVYGQGGSYAKGGTLYLTINDQEISIVDSDICRKNVDKSIQVQDTINNFIK